VHAGGHVIHSGGLKIESGGLHVANGPLQVDDMLLLQGSGLHVNGTKSARSERTTVVVAVVEGPDKLSVFFMRIRRRYPDTTVLYDPEMSRSGTSRDGESTGRLDMWSSCIYLIIDRSIDIYRLIERLISNDRYFD
jgi:hypothetical protein